MSKVLELYHVNKIISNHNQRHTILKDISLQIEKGTITAIVGKSGSGKTTLLSIAGGIDNPDGGIVKILGTSYYELKQHEQEKFRNKNIGLIFQNYHLIPELTCEENIRMPLCFSHEKENAEKLEDWIKAVGLKDKKRLYPNQLSGGEQQRTAILRAIVNDPEIIFADEPTGALDSKTGSTVINFLIRYAHVQKKTIVIVTHDMDIARRCDEVFEIADGRIV